MAIENAFFRQVMGRFTTGVTVVTTHSHKGPVGLTINSFCSVSLDPALVLICVDHNSHTLRYFRESGSFVVNILTDQQERLSRCFATSSQERYEHFCHASYHLATNGAPIIDGVLAYIAACIVNEYPCGDHMIFVGQVETLGIRNHGSFAGEAVEHCSNLTEHDDGAKTDNEAAPLVYYRGEYHFLDTDYQRPGQALCSAEQGYVTQISPKRAP